MANKSAISRITVEAKAGNLSLIRKFINTGMKAQGFPHEKISAMKVCVTEHCENIIKHAYGAGGGSVTIVMELNMPSAKITALDSGARFDITKYNLPDTALRIKKGMGGRMGLKTILALCDKVSYSRKKGINENVFILGREKKGRVKK